MQRKNLFSSWCTSRGACCSHRSHPAASSRTSSSHFGSSSWLLCLLFCTHPLSFLLLLLTRESSFSLVIQTAHQNRGIQTLVVCQPTSPASAARLQHPVPNTGSKEPGTPEVGSIPGTEESWLGLPAQPTSPKYPAHVKHPHSGSKVPCTPEVGSLYTGSRFPVHRKWVFIPGTEEARLGLPGEAPSLPCSHLLSNGLLHLNRQSIFQSLTTTQITTNQSFNIWQPRK